MKRGAHISILHQSKISTSFVSLSSQKSLSTLGQVQCSDSGETLSQFPIVIQDENLLEKAPNGNLLVLDLIDRGAIKPNARLYNKLFKKCTDQGKLKLGQMVHTHFLGSRFIHYVVLQNTVMNMYAQCRDMGLARQVFDGMTEKDMVSYNILISGYSQSNEFKEALGLYVEMVKMGFQPTEFTFGSALKSAGGMQSDAAGWGIHGTCINCGYEEDVYVGYALVDMYTLLGLTRILHTHMCRNFVNFKKIIQELSKSAI